MSTDHLKDKFKILLGRWLTKRSERQFAEMMAMINNYDKNEEDPKNGKPKQKTDVRKGKLNTDINDLDLDVIEEQQDLEESQMTSYYEGAHRSNRADHASAS